MELEVERNSGNEEESDIIGGGGGKVNLSASEIEYVSYDEGEDHLPLIMGLVDQELSEPYSIFTYRYFVYLWPQLCFLAFHRGKCVGTVVCKMGSIATHTEATSPCSLSSSPTEEKALLPN
ncbi:hypothetical protein GBA52_028537 [Prunus armeniaca]|nr:hypothetical protein GBA52_028537 [Prunus armeniaca]